MPSSWVTSILLCGLVVSGCQTEQPAAVSYNDLTDRPDLGVFALEASLAPVASSGAYGDLSGAPDLGLYAQQSSLSPVAQSGAYGDLSGTPDLSPYALQSSLAPVALTGSYADLADRPALDPGLGQLTEGKWCRAAGGQITCVDELDLSALNGAERSCEGGKQYFDAAAGAFGPCEEGHFVLSATTFSANLGGLAGADRLCFDHLVTHDWRGKPSRPLRTAQVRAFLCDSAECNNLLPNTTYAFAVADSPSAGGARFITDARGYGPGNMTDWSEAPYFAAIYRYFTGRGFRSATIWSTTPRPDPPPSGYDANDVFCQDWTSDTIGVGNWSPTGLSAYVDERRWKTNGRDYCYAARLICIVDP